MIPCTRALHHPRTAADIHGYLQDTCRFGWKFSTFDGVRVRCRRLEIGCRYEGSRSDKLCAVILSPAICIARRQWAHAQLHHWPCTVRTGEESFWHFELRGHQHSNVLHIPEVSPYCACWNVYVCLPLWAFSQHHGGSRLSVSSKIVLLECSRCQSKGW